MVQIIDEKNNKTWMAWTLNIAILVITGLISFGVANVNSQITDIRETIKEMIKVNHTQDICIRELQIRQSETERKPK